MLVEHRFQGGDMTILKAKLEDRRVISKGIILQGLLPKLINISTIQKKKKYAYGKCWQLSIY